MEYKRLGKSGLKVSRLSFGAWVTFDNQLQVDTAKACMKAAYDHGVNFFDNAEAYAAGKAEVIMGQVLQETGWSRDSFIVSSKVFFGAQQGETKPTQRGLSRKHIRDACDQALQRMHLEYLDLFYCHRPDPETPIEETVFAMNELIRQGKILYWGTSEWSAQEIMEAFMVARQYNLVPPTMEQPQYNMLHRYRFEVEYERIFSEMGYGSTTWSPLASGILTGKYNDGIPEGSRLALPSFGWLREMLLGENAEAKLAKVRELGGVAQDLGISMPQLALAWTLKNPHVSSVITGASKVSQVESNMQALDAVPLLTGDVMQRIDSILGDPPQAG